ncbi:MAG: SDR family NAD(P)-dependent oxidoreductase [Acidobacteriales bacterium]|nr:SDR family NAD(P)-dependent oxidoreductase [Terriglobales bacterium]
MAGEDLSGKVAVITGASMGIGEEIARLFAAHGASVVLLSRDPGRAESARARIGNTDRTLALACDVRNPEEIDRVISLTLHHFRRIDIWINNAGHGIQDSIASAEMAACRETFETNFFGALAGMKAVIPLMRAQRSGAIINVSSVAGHIPVPFMGIYCATKFALNAIGKAARMEEPGINVLTVCPGYVRTEFSANAVRGKESNQVRPESVRGISAERVARAVLRGYKQQKREVVVPWTMKPAITLYQLFPGLVERVMVRAARSSRAQSTL